MPYYTKYLNERRDFKLELDIPPHQDLNMVVVIPSLNETNLLNSLQSIYDCEKPRRSVEVICVINSSESTLPDVIVQNRQSYSQAREWAVKHNCEKLNFFIMYQSNLPEKVAGVGLARKVGMDLATYRLFHVNNPEGIILSFDADSLCKSNYLVETERFFYENSNISGCSIYYEHPLEGKDYTLEIYQAIIQYELHLRYYIQAQRYAGFPFAFHTVGSCFAVRAEDYIKQGGMNKRKAGEDFYFLHKFIPSGNFLDMNTTTIIPSPRPSNRVPFGTGAAVRKMLRENIDVLKTYHPGAFLELRKFLLLVPDFYLKPPTLVQIDLEKLSSHSRRFLIDNDIVEKLKEAEENSSTQEYFLKRFYSWFNAFRLLKFLNYLHEKQFERIAVQQAVITMLQWYGVDANDWDSKKMLYHLREMHKNDIW